jgi:hypothetical protein
MSMQPPETTGERLDRLLGRVMGEARLSSEALVRRVTAIRQRGLRRPVLGEMLRGMDDALLLAALNDLVLRARSGHGGSREVVQEIALEPGLIAHLPYERVQLLYELCSAHGLRDVQSLFLSTRTLDRQESHTENEYLTLPLGVRKQAARTQDRFLLDRLLRDRNVDVIRNLLQNPRLTERDILVVAAMRPTRPEILQAIAEHTRWSSRYRVRKALACNPHTPSAIALNLLSTLMVQDLRFLLGSGVLAAELQAEAERLVQRKDPTPQDDESVDRVVDDLVQGWRAADAEVAEAEEEEIEAASTLPTSEAFIAAHQAAQRAARRKVLESLQYPDAETREEFLPPSTADIVLEEDQVSPEELESEVDQLIKDWLILDRSISAEMVALAEFTQVEALHPDEAPKVNWPSEAELTEETPPDGETMELVAEGAALKQPSAPVDPTQRAVARLLAGWQQRDGEIDEALFEAADQLEIEVMTPDRRREKEK